MSYDDQKQIATEPLHAVLLDTIKYAERTRIREKQLLGAFGLAQSMVWAGDVWTHLVEQLLPDGSETRVQLQRMIRAGTLSTRIGKPLRRFPTRKELHTVYSELAECLAHGELFRVP